MGRFKIKPPKKPLNVRRAVESLQNTLNGTALIAGLIYPPITPEEDAKARFVANSLLTQLAKPEKDQDQKSADRHRAIVAVYMFQMITQGIINFMRGAKDQRLAARQAEKSSPVEDTSKPLTDDEKQIIKARMIADGIKFEEVQNK